MPRRGGFVVYVKKIFDGGVFAVIGAGVEIVECFAFDHKQVLTSVQRIPVKQL